MVTSIPRPLEKKRITLEEKLKQMSAFDAMELQKADKTRRELLGDDTVNVFDSFLARYGC